MHENILLQVSNKIKDTRKQKNLTIHELASKAHVSKGLVSQIENNRTIPSLPVLMKIIAALNVDLNHFFTGIDHQLPGEVLLKKSKDYSPFEKENADGFKYKRILSRNIEHEPVDIVLLELKKGAFRKNLVYTDAYEYKYMIEGKVEYLIGGKKYILEEGDSIFFDGRLGHKPRNIGTGKVLMLVVYFFLERETKTLLKYRK